MPYFFYGESGKADFNWRNFVSVCSMTFGIMRIIIDLRGSFLKSLNDMKNISWIILPLACLFMVACSSDDDNGGSPLPDSSASFTISGDIEGEKTGLASAILVESAGTYIFDIGMSDAAGGGQTFSLSFFIGPSDEEIEVPEPGDYTIATTNAGDFWVVYTELEGVDGREYGSIWETSGTMTITASGDDFIEGEFEFEAAGDPDDALEPQGSITVTNGEFRAEVF